MTPNDTTSCHVKSQRVLTLFGLLVIIAMASLPLVVGPPPENGLPDLAKFIGRFHPVVLHLPIGIFVWVLVQECLNLFSKGGTQYSSRAAIGFAALSAIAASLLGFLLYYSMPDYDSEIAGRHLWGGLVFSCIAVAAFVVKSWVDSAAGKGSLIYRIILLVGAVVMGITSHDGASLTHGKDYLTEHSPAPLRKLLGLPEKKPSRAEAALTEKHDPVVYTEIIIPILESKCYACHNAEKQKGRYRMDEYDLLVKGGKEGKGLIPGDSAASNLIVRIELPMDDDEHMPPEGKKDIEDKELVLLKWWIDQGASEDAKLSALTTTQEILEILAVPSSETPAQAETKAVRPLDDSQLKQLKTLPNEYPAALQQEYQGSGSLVFNALGMREKFGDADLAKLRPLVGAIVSMDLSHTNITDAGVALLSSGANLRNLRLSETQISDRAIDTLVQLQSLESLNLYATQITNSAALKLASLPKLRKLYLWQTRVDEETIRTLREKMPACEVITGQQ